MPSAALARWIEPRSRIARSNWSSSGAARARSPASHATAMSILAIADATGTRCVPSDGRRRACGRGEDPEIVLRKLEVTIAAAGIGHRRPVAAQPHRTELEQILLAIAEEHAGDELGTHAIVARAVGDPRALEADDAGRRIARLQRAARGAP